MTVKSNIGYVPVQKKILGDRLKILKTRKSL